MAVAYAREGAHCVLVARTVGGLEAVDDQIKGWVARPPWCRSTSPTARGIDRLGAALHERFGRLDVLPRQLPASWVACRRSGTSSPACVEQIMAVNVTANWRLIRSLDPLLRASDAGRAIFVTSGISRRVVA